MGRHITLLNPIEFTRSTASSLPPPLMLAETLGAGLVDGWHELPVYRIFLGQSDFDYFGACRALVGRNVMTLGMDHRLPVSQSALHSWLC